MLKEYPDLEIRLDKFADVQDDLIYSVEYRLSLPGSDAFVGSSLKQPSTTTFDFAVLRQHEVDPDQYGKLLSKALFTEELKSVLSKAVAVAETGDFPLRVRLLIGSTAGQLHSLRWETLCSPEDDTTIATNERILFSRYLGSSDMRPVGLAPRARLRALIVIANPSDLATYSLAPVDVNGELARAKSAFGKIDVKCLLSEGPATLEAIFRELREGYDILYLVCHGVLRKIEVGEGETEQEPWLFLENRTGVTRRVSGREFTTSLRQLRHCPRLVVLASCESSGTGQTELNKQGDDGVLASLGPLLAAEGVPAIIAMQGKVSMDTIARFMPVVFRELNKHGEIDQAVAAGRKEVQDRSDWWMPVLYSRLKSGRLWYAPGLGRDGKGFGKWPAVIDNIDRKKCTPILGPGLSEHILGSRQEMAHLWAESYEFPMSPHEQDDFPRIAQYLSVAQQPQFPVNKFLDSLAESIRSRIPKDQRESLAKLPLHKLIEKVGRQVRSYLPADPYEVLALLDLPIYITTDPTDLLADALREAGRNPVSEYCRWKNNTRKASEIKNRPEYEPTPEEPLVFHLFGRVAEPNSLVITEDNYFDYLAGMTRNKDLIPEVVRDALVDSGLLFLGFQMEDWNFRVLLRSILDFEGSSRRAGYAHVAAQIDPNRILDPDGARRYLEECFQASTQVNIYWGTIEEFIGELQRRWKEKNS